MPEKQWEKDEFPCQLCCSHIICYASTECTSEQKNICLNRWENDGGCGCEQDFEYEGR